MMSILLSSLSAAGSAALSAVDWVDVLGAAAGAFIRGIF